MSKIFQISQVEEGMVLAEPILNKLGQVLLGANVTLSKKHLNFFKIWNIDYVSIVSDEEEINDIEFSSDEYELAIAKLARRFSWTPRNILEEELLEIGLYTELDKIRKMKEGIN